MLVSIAPCTPARNDTAFLMGQLCLQIDRPFHAAFVDLECVDNDHVSVAAVACFDDSWRVLGLGAYMNIYTSVGGVVLSTSRQTGAYDPTLPWTNAPAFDGAGRSRTLRQERLFLPFSKGLSIRLRSVGSAHVATTQQTQIFEHPLSLYAVTVDDSIQPTFLHIVTSITFDIETDWQDADTDAETRRCSVAELVGTSCERVSVVSVHHGSEPHARTRLLARTTAMRFRVEAAAAVSDETVSRIAWIEKNHSVASAALNMSISRFGLRDIVVRVSDEDTSSVSPAPSSDATLDACTVDFLRARDVQGHVAVGSDGHLLAEFTQMERFVVETLLQGSLEEYWCAASTMPDLTCLDMASADTFSVVGPALVHGSVDDLTAVMLSLSANASYGAVRRYGDTRVDGRCGTHGDGVVDAFDMTLLLMHQFQVAPYDQQTQWSQQQTVDVTKLDRCTEHWLLSPERDPEVHAMAYEDAVDRCDFLTRRTPNVSAARRRLSMAAAARADTAAFDLEASVHRLRDTAHGTWYRIRWRGVQMALQLALEGVWTFQRVAMSNVKMDTRDDPVGHEVRFERWSEDVDRSHTRVTRCAMVEGAIGPGSALLGDTISVYQQTSGARPAYCRFDLYLHVPTTAPALLGLRSAAEPDVQSSSECAVRVLRGSRGANGGYGAFQNQDSRCSLTDLDDSSSVPLPPPLSPDALAAPPSPARPTAPPPPPPLSPRPPADASGTAIAFGIVVGLGILLAATVGCRRSRTRPTRPSTQARPAAKRPVETVPLLLLSPVPNNDSSEESKHHVEASIQPTDMKPAANASFPSAN